MMIVAHEALKCSPHLKFLHSRVYERMMVCQIHRAYSALPMDDLCIPGVFYRLYLTRRHGTNAFDCAQAVDIDPHRPTLNYE